jgi:hypothetical protein
MKARYITENDEIKAGDILFDKHPNFAKVTEVTVLKVTKTQIVTEHIRYAKEGYCIGDRFMRRRLYKAI